MYSLKSPHRGDSNENTQHTIFVLSSKRPVASRPDAMANSQWVVLPMSRINFHGPKDVRVIEVRLYPAKLRFDPGWNYSLSITTRSY